MRRLRELSGEACSAVLLDGRGELAAWRSPDPSPEGAAPDGARAAADLRDLVRAADAAEGDTPWAQVEVVTPAGAVFVVRDRGWTLAAACGRAALPSLMFLDLRSVIAALAPAPA